MEKIFCISCFKSDLGDRIMDIGLSEVNQELQKGWYVKNIFATSPGDSHDTSNAYVVLSDDSKNS
jgi:hypothetical protein